MMRLKEVHLARIRLTKWSSKCEALIQILQKLKRQLKTGIEEWPRLWIGLTKPQVRQFAS